MALKTILLIDDDEVDRLSVARALDKQSRCPERKAASAIPPPSSSSPP